MTMPTFLASSPRMARRRLDLGCSFLSESATRLLPMRPSTSILPDAISAGTMVLPRPYTVFTTPLGKASVKACSRG
jgi:hypothetical protein